MQKKEPKSYGTIQVREGFSVKTNRFIAGALFALFIGVLLGASNIPQGWTLNTVLNSFQVLMKDGGGTRLVPVTKTYSGTMTFGGGAYSSGANTMAINIVKNGKGVILCLRGIQTITMTAATNIYSGTFPVEFAPTTTSLYLPIPIMSNGVVSMGSVNIGTNGLMRVYYNINETSNWPAAANSGWEPFCVPYSVDQ